MNRIFDVDKKGTKDRMNDCSDWHYSFNAKKLKRGKIVKAKVYRLFQAHWVTSPFYCLSFGGVFFGKPPSILQTSFCEHSG